MINQPTHEEISQRAHRLWQETGPEGGDATQNWLDAERELATAATNANDMTAQPGQPLGESHSALALAERAAQQRKEAREPMVPTHTGPKSTPPETGKPLWSRPHSS